MTSPHTIRCHTLRESERALPPGRWVTKGAIKVYEPQQLALDFRDTPDIANTSAEQQTWDTLALNLIATPPPRTDRPERALCDDCGCLIAPAERCPRCLVWALKDEQQWEWAREREANRHVIWTILDARKSVAA